MFWQIGKNVIDSKKREDIINRISNYYGYRYGLSETFSIYNIQLMKCFYLCFPIFRVQLLELEWEHYVRLISITNSHKRLFYFHLSLFCKLTVSQLQIFIDEFLYERI